jgi:hypothetical protein
MKTPRLSLIHQNKEEYFNIEALSEALIDQLPNSDEFQTRLDMAFLVLLSMGNDYVAQVPGICFSTLVERFLEMKKTNPDEILFDSKSTSLNIKYLREILEPFYNPSGYQGVQTANEYLMAYLWYLKGLLHGDCPSYSYIPPDGSLKIKTIMEDNLPDVLQYNIPDDSNALHHKDMPFLVKRSPSFYLVASK